MHTRIAEMGLSTETIHIGAQHRNNTTICTHTHKHTQRERERDRHTHTDTHTRIMKNN